MDEEGGNNGIVQEEGQPAEQQVPDSSSNKPAAALRRRRLWKRLRWLLWLLLMAPLVYLAVQIFIILAPRMRTEVAFQGSMTDAITVVGQVVLSSEPVYGMGEHIYYTVPLGQRVAADAEVAQVFTSGDELEAMDNLSAIDRELELLTSAQATTAESGDLEALLSDMQSGIYTMLEAVETGDYAAMPPPLGEATLAANKLQIATGQANSFENRVMTLIAQRRVYESRAVPKETIVSPATGYFVPSAKDDRIQRSYDDLADLSPAALTRVLEAEQPHYSDDVVGHVVTDYKWHFFTVVTAREADKFVPGDKSLRLSFPEAGDTSMPVTVNSVRLDDAQEYAVVELYCEYIGPEVLQLRTEKAQIIFDVKEGLRISKDALRLVDVRNEAGMVVTYQGVYVKFGNMVYFRKIDILLEDEFDMLVGGTYTEGTNEVRMYDEVVVDPGGEELYDRKIL